MALILGLIQGLTEFLPVSSTAHLVLFPWALGWNDPLLDSLDFDVALHIGTLVAVLIYFREDWVKLISAFFSSIRKKKADNPYERLVWLILFATIPAGVIGLKFQHQVEHAFRSPLLIAAALAGVGVVMIFAERSLLRRPRSLSDMNVKDALIIGFAQASAIVPGVSRSGSTIIAGLFTGFSRDEAARFSFLLSTPIIAGASILKFKHLLHGFLNGEAATLSVGIIASAVSGYLAIAFLISWVKRNPLNVFAYYRIALAVGIAALYLAK